MISRSKRENHKISVLKKLNFQNFSFGLKFSLILSWFVFFYISTHGTLNPFLPLTEQSARMFFHAAQADSLIHGRLDVPPTFLAGSQGECWTNLRDERCYGYFGIFPSLIRIPFLFFGVKIDYLGAIPFSLLYVFVLFKVSFKAIRNVASQKDFHPNYGFIFGLSIGFSPIALLPGRLYVYEESIVLSVTLLVILLARYYSKKTLGVSQELILVGLIVFSTVNTRIDFGFAALIIGFHQSVSLLKSTGKKQLIRRFFLVLLTPVFSVTSILALNFLKLGEVLPSLTSQHGGTLASISRVNFYKQYGEFNFERIPSSMLALILPDLNSFFSGFTFSPNDYVVKLLGQNISLSTVEQSEYFSPITVSSLCSIFLLFLTLIAVYLRSDNRISELVYICGLSVPIVFIASFIGLTERYLNVFTPLLIYAVFAYAKMGEPTSVVTRYLLHAALIVQVFNTIRLSLEFWKYSMDRPSTFDNLLDFRVIALTVCALAVIFSLIQNTHAFLSNRKFLELT